MKVLHKTIGMILAAVFFLALLPSISLASGGWETGNTDLNILNGGIMLSDGENLYFTDGGIFVQKGQRIIPLTADLGKNLNIYDGYIYYTFGSQIKRVPSDGGKCETVFSAQDDIKQMYIVNGEPFFLSGGQVFKAASGSAEKLASPDSVFGFIPTAYGMIYLTGKALDYTVYAGTTIVLSGVQSAYTDSGYLAVERGSTNYMIALEKLFLGVDPQSALERFSIHGKESAVRLLNVDEEKFVSEYNENTQLQCDFEAILLAAGMRPMTEETTSVQEPEQPVIPTVSQGQLNIVKRARQLTGIQWTPLADRYQWGYKGAFNAGTTYTGLPYGQPVNNNGYVGFGVSLDGYMEAVNDNTSSFYSGYSTYNKIAPYYSTDCSGFASYCWQVEKRRTTYSLPEVCEKISDQSIYALQLGDIFNNSSSHVVLVTDVIYDSQGAVTQVEISEQTPVITKVTRYGEGQSKSLASLQSYYLNGGYAIYRYPNRDNVTYTPSPYVSVDGENSGLKAPAPKVKAESFRGGRSITLYTENNATIHYTTDGSVPTESSPVYSDQTLSTTDTLKVKALAVSDGYNDSAILTYEIFVPYADKPSAAITGTNEGGLVASGSRITLTSSKDATVYYTTDGSEPTESSSVYSSPITVTSDVTIKAMAVGSGFRQSATASFSYKIGHVYTIEATSGSGGSVSPSGKTEVFQTRSANFTIKASPNYAIEDVLVDGTSVGAVATYTFSKISESHSISASFKLNVSMPFSDVTESDWFYEAVGFAYARNLFNGTSDSTFSPSVTMTRGMFVTVLGRFAGVDLPNEAKVGLVTGSDVNIRSAPSTDSEIQGVVDERYTAVEVTGQSGEWYAVKFGKVEGYIRNDLISVYAGTYSDIALGMYYSPYVQWACLVGVTKGSATDVFDADSGISRQDMCLMLNNYATSHGIEVPIVESKVTFADDAQISESAKTAVYALQQADVVNGVGDGLFSPSGTATRSEVAQIFENYVRAVG